MTRNMSRNLSISQDNDKPFETADREASRVNCKIIFFLILDVLLTASLIVFLVYTEDELKYCE